MTTTTNSSTQQAIEAAHRIISERVIALATELPGITFGYIGNLDARFGDDRSWRIFLPHEGRIGVSMVDCVYLGPTTNLPTCVERWSDLEAQTRRNYDRESRDARVRQLR